MLLKKNRRFLEIFLATAITKAAGGFLMQNFDILVEYYLLNKTCKFHMDGVIGEKFFVNLN
jgi:hypothetical protein